MNNEYVIFVLIYKWNYVFEEWFKSIMNQVLAQKLSGGKKVKKNLIIRWNHYDELKMALRNIKKDEQPVHVKKRSANLKKN